MFLLVPGYGEDYQVLLPVFDAIDIRHRIDLANPFEFPEFYAIENHFDGGHLNDQGARLLTRKLAQKFSELPVHPKREIKGVDK